MNYSVVIVAAGKGIRANLGYNKNFFEIEEGKVPFFHKVYDFIQIKGYIFRFRHSNHSFSETCFCGQSEDVRFDRTQSPILTAEFHEESQILNSEIDKKTVSRCFRIRIQTVFFYIVTMRPVF